MEFEDDVVISGISGKFPESENIEQLKQHLFNNVDLINTNSRRWTKDLYNLPPQGELRSIKNFDTGFFGVHMKQANVMDPQGRMLLELTYEALVDAGINPTTVRGSNVGVFVGVGSNDTHQMVVADAEAIIGYELLGNALTLLANRISYAFDFNGPSCALDTACSSSLVAFERAVSYIKSGEITGAVVAGCNLLLNPIGCLQFTALGVVSAEGKCKTFDDSSNGYIRSEAIGVVYLQKAKQAKRIYATVLGATTNTDGFKEQGITSPSGKMQSHLVASLYNELKVDPATVAYVEAHGTGTPVDDSLEINAMVDVYCKNRKTPLLLGSVKSNMGHAEAASGICSLIKVIISMESGIIPANLHFKTPNKNIPALHDGRIKVVTENQPWNGGVAAINSFAIGGVNAHIVLKSHPKLKTSKSSLEVLPRLIVVSGRTLEAVEFFLQKVTENKEDNEFLALINNLHESNISGHPFRGYIINSTVHKEISEVHNTSRPICFLYSGMGSQWPSMGKDLMEIKLFKESIDRSANTLKQFGIDLVDLITTSPECVFETSLTCFVAIASIQIALTNILKYIGIEPDIIIGHSAGEAGCSYADGGLTDTQTILLSYYRGLAVQEANVPVGAMAAVGLSWDDAFKRCPPDIFPVCCNGKDNVTISGPTESIEKFVAELKSNDIFAKKINSGKRAFHSKYVASVVPILREYLRKLIPEPNARTSKWISTSIPEAEWGSPLAQTCSGDYHVNNFISPVLFHQAASHIPEDAIVIEIAPTDLFKSVLKKTLGPKATFVSLNNKYQSNNVEYFLSNIGKIYNAGAQPQIMKLYDTIEYPVSSGTPMLSSLVKWDHSTELFVCEYEKLIVNSPSTVTVDLRREKDKFLTGHCIGGIIECPASYYIIIAWTAFAKLRHKQFEKMPVILQDIKFLRTTILPKNKKLKFSINILETGEFEISEGGSVVACGKILEPEDINKELLNLPPPEVDSKEYLSLSENDIYKEFRIRGCEYEDQFRGICQCDNEILIGQLKPNNNWISFLDTVIQFSILSHDNKLNEMSYLSGVVKLIINPEKHLEILKNCSNEGVSVYSYPDLGIIKSGAIEIRGLKYSVTSHRTPMHADPILEMYQFIPYENDDILTDGQALTVLSHIVYENCSLNYKFNIAEINTNDEANKLIEVKKILDREPQISIQANIICPNSLNKDILKSNGINHIKIDPKCNFIDITPHLLIMDSSASKDSKIFTNATHSLIEGGFVLIEEKDKNVDIKNLNFDTFKIVSYQKTEDNWYILLRKLVSTSSNSVTIKVTETDFNWVEPLKTAVRESEQKGNKVYLYSQGHEVNGIIGMVNCLKREPGGKSLRTFFIQDENTKDFSTVTDDYNSQLRKDFIHNVFKNGKWGSYRHLLLDSEKNKLVKCAYVDIIKRGDLRSFRWIEDTLPTINEINQPRKEICSVFYSAINFRDVMLASEKKALYGSSKANNTIGFEFSGISISRKRLMGISNKCLATHVLTDPTFTWEVPNEWSLEEASTVPVVYTTAYYSLIVRARMKPGESILIHSGAGGVGIASINIALSMGCTIFTTVGSEVKRNFIRKTFPQISDKYISSSRDNSFEQMILKGTKGRGVDIVLNSLSNKQLQASVRCLANEGRFLELGKIDLKKSSNLGMSLFLKNCAFHGILVDSLCGIENDDKRETSLLMKKGIANGIIKPLPTTVFDATNRGIEQAFRYLASGKHIGKVIVKIQDDENMICQPTIASIPCTYMNPSKSYIVVGGLGGVGLELSKWLISKRVNKLVVTSRSGIKTGYQSMCVRKWKESGVKVLISTVDAATSTGAIELLKQATNLGDIGGIFNLAGVWSDKLLENESKSNFKMICKPKIDVTKQLDLASRDLAPNLDYFVCFTSIASSRGNIGQSNYAFANSTMEGICEIRKSKGLPSLIIEWGPIDDAGLILEAMKLKNNSEILGTLPQRMLSCLTVLDYFLQQSQTILCSYVVANTHKVFDTEEKVTLIDMLCNILGTKNSIYLPLTVTLVDLGMDSMMAAEAKHYLQRVFSIHLSLEEVMASTINDLLKLESKAINSEE